MANVRVPTTVKNLSIGFSSQPGDTYIKNLQGFTTISGGLVTASGIQLRVSSTGGYTTVLSGAGEVEKKDRSTVIWSLTSAAGKRLFGWWYYTLYEGSVAHANIIPDGSSLDPSHYRLEIQPSWHYSDADSHNPLKLTIFMQNLDSSPKTILHRVNARYIVNIGT